MPRHRDLTDTELSEELAGFLTGPAWEYGLKQVARCIRGIRTRILAGDSTLVPAFREQKLLIDSLYSAAGLDLPPNLAALFE